MAAERAGDYPAPPIRWRTLAVFGVLAAAITLLLTHPNWWPGPFMAIVLVAVAGHQSETTKSLDPESWLKGKRGEEQVLRLIGKLQADGYSSLERVETPNGTVDYVLAGPGGIFTVEMKHWAGRFYRKDGKLLHNGVEAEDVVQLASRRAGEIAAVLERSGLRVGVDALIVSTEAPVLRGPIVTPHATLLEAGDLASFVKRIPRRLSTPAVEVAKRAIATAAASSSPATA